jgi:hypothetical protein
MGYSFGKAIKPPRPVNSGGPQPSPEANNGTVKFPGYNTDGHRVPRTRRVRRTRRVHLPFSIAA